MPKNWFEVDKPGLAKLVESHGPARCVLELVSNGFDTDTTLVKVHIERVKSTRLVNVTVEDDSPEGFRDLTHAYTLFAESERKGDETKRGRFNLGEKLVLAYCTKASIISTNGTLIFDDAGRHTSRSKTEEGTKFIGQMRMTNKQMEEAIEMVTTIIPPEGVTVTLNDKEVVSAPVIRRFKVKLPTLKANEDGILKNTQRICEVTLHESSPWNKGVENPHLYEMGIPVVPIDCKWEVNIHQKVPLNMNRDNVTPAYLAKLQVAILNETFDLLEKEDASHGWARSAAGNDEVQEKALRRVLDLRFGEKRAAFNPSDPEANARAVAEGYSLVQGGSLSKDEWRQVKTYAAVPASSQVTPSYRAIKMSLTGEHPVHEEDWTDGMKQVSFHAKRLAQQLMGLTIAVRMTNQLGANYLACYGNRTITFNMGRLGRKWFDLPRNHMKINELILHEFGHEYASSHLDDNYYHALCRLGVTFAKCATIDQSLVNGEGRFDGTSDCNA